MKVGFTGTRDGMTNQQREKLTLMLKEICNITEFHHGGCVGADIQAHHIALTFSFPIHVHPAVLSGSVVSHYLDSIKPEPNIIVYKEKQPLVRNHDIVDSCDMLIACPKGIEILRSGTWATVRYARKKGRVVHIISVDGELLN